MNLTIWSTILNNKLFIFVADLNDSRMTISQQISWWIPKCWRRRRMNYVAGVLVARLKEIEAFNKEQRVVEFSRHPDGGGREDGK